MALYLTDKGVHSKVYKVNNNVHTETSKSISL